MLDDPLQSLDDVNLLGLVDTLRRTKSVRQLIISTHDPRFASLLERKLRPVGSGERTVVVELNAWTTDGPAIKQRELPREPSVFKVAATSAA
jgi:exonuclease SbcC